MSSEIGPEIRKAELNSMISFTKLSISQFRELISPSSNSRPSLEILPSHALTSFSDYYFFLKLINFSLKAAFFPVLLNSFVKPRLKKANFDTEDFSNYKPISNRSYFSKQLERAVFMQIREQFEKISLFSK